jgi:hypothetical protein
MPAILYVPRVPTLALVALSLLLPHRGAFVPWQSLGGVRLGMTPAQVEQRWGTSHGRCRACKQETWYYNYKPFHPEGAAVRFTRGTVDAVWTLWSPPGWHVGDLVVGAAEQEVTKRYPATLTVHCGSYAALVLTRRRVTTAFYVYNGSLWGFGLNRSTETACR